MLLLAFILIIKFSFNMEVFFGVHVAACMKLYMYNNRIAIHIHVYMYMYVAQHSTTSLSTCTELYIDRLE